MRYEGQTFLASAQQCWVILGPDGIVRCPQHTRWTSGLIALRLPEGVELESLAIEPELLAQGLDLANAGQQYGDTVYLRSLTGFVLAPEVLGQYRLKASQAQADAASDTFAGMLEEAASEALAETLEERAPSRKSRASKAA